MPISMGKVGETYVIQRVTGAEEVRAHLGAMGFTPGTEVRLISRLSGDVIIGVKESRVAVNEDQARHILV